MPPRPKPAQHLLNLELLFNKLKQKAGVPDARFTMPTSYHQVPTRFEDGSVGYDKQNIGPFQPVQDEGNYTPRAVAMQGQNTVAFNPNNRETQMMGLKHGHKYDQFVVAHELGHLVADKRLQNEAAADNYTKLRMGWVPPADTPRSIFGHLPLDGPAGGSTHTSPNEQYANDVAAALGRRWKSGGPLSAAARKQKILIMQKLGILPR